MRRQGFRPWSRLAALVPVFAALLFAPRPAAAQTAPPPADAAALAAQVKAEFLHAWRGYKQYAWGHDELRPLSREPRDWYKDTPLYMTPVDALDTMLLMGLDDEANETRAYLDAHLSFDHDIWVKNFEITIRILGGLLSAYQMTGDRQLLAKAEDLGHRLLPVFDSPTGMPYMYVNLKTGATGGPDMGAPAGQARRRAPRGASNPAEVGTLILEWGTLARLTGDQEFYDRPKRALVALFDRRAKTGLVGDEIDVDTGKWLGRTSHIGGGIDSFYEYLVKCERLFDDADCGRMAKATLAAANKYLADQRPNGLWYGEANMNTGRRTATVYGALQAFFPAVLVLSGDVGRAERLQTSNFRMWMLDGIEPEELNYRTMKIRYPGYQLRPENIESAYYLFHATHDPRYLDMGRDMFESLVRYCRTDDGYTILTSVVTKEQGDRMHSFFLAETLKYLYLLFDPQALDLDSVVFNTEAHPLRKVQQ